MYHLRIMILGLATFALLIEPAYSSFFEYTVEDLMNAYESGQYRTISTHGLWLEPSPDGSYIYAKDDGVYRISDGAFFQNLDNVSFSPDGRYVAQRGDGVYRLHDMQQIISTEAKVVFSNDGAYVAVNEDGVYRLDTGQKIIASDSFESRFSPDSSAVATLDGVFSLSNSQLLFETGGYYADFGFGSTYVVTREGIYNITDGTKVLDSTGRVFFTPDGLYAVIFEDGVYRLADGQRLYDLPVMPPDFSRPQYSSDGQYMAVESNGLYRIHDGEKLSDSSDMVFSPDSSHVAIGQDGVYRLEDMQKQFAIESDISSLANFSSDGAYLATPHGIFRVSDGQKFFTSGLRATFSPNSEYVIFDDDGVYRLSDQQKIYDIVGIVTRFTPDEAYMHVINDGNSSMYRVHDGKYYPGLQIIDISTRIMAMGNTALIIDAM